MKRVLITGGFGYIGGSISLALSKRGYAVYLLDNGACSEVTAVRALKLGAHGYLKGDVLNESDLTRTLRNFNPHSLIHCAGLKSVAEGQSNPKDYWGVNVGGTFNVCKAWGNRGRLVFSGSASVYGSHLGAEPIPDNWDVDPVSVYGQTKACAEKLLPANAVSLRYFNPAGVYAGVVSTNKASGNLFDVIRNTKGTINVYGDDWPTPDGTCVRDYIHIEDLVEAHIWALDTPLAWGGRTYNIGTGKGTSVKQIMDAMNLDYTIAPRRDGDVPSLVAGVRRATADGFTCKKTIEDIIASELESKNK